MKSILLFMFIFAFLLAYNSHILLFQQLFNLFNMDLIFQENYNDNKSPDDINNNNITVKETTKVASTPVKTFFDSKTDKVKEKNVATTPIPQRVLDLDLMLSNDNKAKCSNCRVVNGDQVVNYETFLQSKQQYQPHINPDDKISVSIITTSTEERLPYLPYILSRWPANLVIAMQIKQNEVDAMTNRLFALKLPKRVFIVLMPTRKGSAFQINKLRNIAMSSVITTHIMIMDMDLWPARNLYHEIQSLPDEILDSPTSAVIVPEFFLKPEPILKNCTTLMDCAIKSERLFPADKAEFITCYNRRQCLTRKFNGVQHMYVELPWFTNKDHYLTMKCFKNRLQEPYLLLKNRKDMLFFDERFVNYGCNKVQYVDLLRVSGYQFYLFTQTFAMDIVHHDSPYRTYYLGYARAGLSDTMRKLCFDFMKKADIHFNETSRVKICDDLYL